MDRKFETKCKRDFLISKNSINEENRTVELAFASEIPYERWYGNEILDLGAESVRLGRLTDAAPLLLNHNTSEQIGVIESVTLGRDRIGRAVVRFGKSGLAEEIFQDVKDGIRQKVSVGYMVHAMTLESRKDDTETYRVTDWEPFEVSIVSIPADASVGIGREFDITTAKKENPMDPQNIAAPAAAPTPTAQEPNIRAVENEIREKEQKRIAELRSVGQAFKHFGGDTLADQMIMEGRSVTDLQTVLLERTKQIKPIQTAELGLSEKEIRQYSFRKALNALSNPNDANAQREAGYELELSAAAMVHQTGSQRDANLVIPYDILRKQKRDLVVGTPTAGGNTVANDLLGSDFIDLLRNKLVLSELGATMMMGLQGNVAIPKQSGSSTAYWVSENSPITASQETFDQVGLTPKTIGAMTGYSRRMLLQASIDVENFIINDLSRVAANGIEAGFFSAATATTSNPAGLFSQSIGSVVGGANGGAAAWSHIVELESKVAIANADVGNLAYVTNPNQRGKLKTASKVSGQNGFIWENGNTPLNGYRCSVSNTIPKNLTKGTATGVCSAIVFGNWSDALIGMWGGLSILVNPYADSAKGNVSVTVMQDVDFALRNTGSFAAMLDAL